MIQDILTPLISEKFKTDCRYKEGHLKVLNALPGRKVLGLHSPDIKAVAKKLSSSGIQNSNSFTTGLQLIMDFEKSDPMSLCYEEMAIWGFMINLEKCPAREKLLMLEKYVPVMDNWGVCDSYVAHAKWMKKIPSDELLTWMDKWFTSNREFEVRFAVVASMSYLVDSKLDDIFSRLDAIDFDSIPSDYKSVKKRPAEIQAGCVLGLAPYYVRMAVAWFLATALAKHPEKTRAYVHSCNLPQDVLKLYIRKARESFRTKNTSPL